MGSLTGLLNLSQNALAANQAAIDITSNNVANQNVAGYTRQVANWQAVDTVSLTGTSVGSGATVTAVSQRDRVLDQRVQQQTQIQSASSALSDGLSQLQTVFGLSATSTSASSTTLGSSIDGFFSSLASLQANPSDNSVRQQVLSSAQTLATNFNAASSAVAAQRSSLNQQVSGIVDQVNALSTSIAALNVQIQSLSPNSDAGGLEDQRQQDVTQLSQLIGFQQTTTEGNGLTLETFNDAPMVSAGKSYALSTAVYNGDVHVYSAPPGSTDITAGLTGGQLGGVLQARDGTLSQVKSALDWTAWQIGTQVNQQNSEGVTAYGTQGGSIFALSPNAGGAAGAISLATTDPSAIAAAGLGDGVGGSTNAVALAALTSAQIVNGQTVSDSFASLLTTIGTAVSQASSDATVQQASLTQLTTQQSSLSGVSLDDEAASLTDYQRSYQAAAKVFSIVNELLASAINLGEQTTVA